MNHRNDDDCLSSSQKSASSQHYFQTFPPESHFIAQGTLEQLRRSKLTRIWKPVLVSLMKQGSPVVVIQRAETRQTLHQFPIEAVGQVELVEDDALTAGEHRFVIRLAAAAAAEDIVLRCPRNREAARNWVSTLRLVGQLLQTTTTPTILHVPEDKNLISFDDPVSPMPRVSQPILPLHQQRPLHPPHLPTFHPPQHPQHHNFPHPQQSTFAQQQYHYPQHFPQPSWNNCPPQYSSPGYAMQTPAMHRPAATRIHSAPVSQPVRPSPLPNPPLKVQSKPLHRSSSAPPDLKTTTTSQKTPCLTPAQLKERVTRDWALRPPAYQCLRDLSQLLPTLHHNFALVAHHAYFDTWPQKRSNMKHVRFFLHPDKWPRDMSTEQTCLLKLLWDVINDAWEIQQQQVGDEK
jgi:hypothetical protein